MRHAMMVLAAGLMFVGACAHGRYQARYADWTRKETPCQDVSVRCDGGDCSATDVWYADGCGARYRCKLRVSGGGGIRLAKGADCTKLKPR